ncbi:hypothetical protein [Bacillus massiliglaciei]|uniref:hypothetical protein n=1 Tax=Bacillus massiliglaciei TaxID=1816693 RepID=UPI000DA6210B|nr:hypothetical protein [Bacillus massiliglaciei]
MSRTPAYKYEIIKGTAARSPQTIRVIFDDGKTAEFTIGPYVTRKRIEHLLPTLVSEQFGRKYNRGKKAC